MVTVIKKGAKKEDLAKAIAKVENLIKFDAYKYCGILKLKEAPLEVQKKMRNEWG